MAKKVQPRMSIYIPPDLRARMDKVKEPVNWSAVACRAFEDKLGEIAAKKEKKTMSDVADRLRASMREDEGEQYQDGFQAGKEWAESTATARHLKRLEAFKKEIDRSGLRWETWFDGNDRDAFCPGEKLADIIEGGDLGRNGMHEFWVNDLGDDKMITEAAWLRGFCEGALDVWEAVQNEL
jgi:hypothetical protein